jgi:ribosomal protein S18 acetylase RimI-like enzyme
VVCALAAGELDLLEPLWSALREHHEKVASHFGRSRPRAQSWARRRAQYEAWLCKPDSFILIAKRDGSPVGYAMVHLRDGSPTWPMSERTGELESLSILPDERGQGTGGALMDAVREQLRALKVTELALHVVPSNTEAIRFYERQGFDLFGLWLTSSLVRSSHRSQTSISDQTTDA